MANYCNFELRVSGKDENVKKFFDCLKSNYRYADKITSAQKEEYLHGYKRHYEKDGIHLFSDAEKHFFRVFDVNLDDEYFDGSNTVLLISGYCAWSVWVCMFRGSKFEENDSETYYSDNYGIYCALQKEHATNMEDITKELDLVVEIFSYEPGVGFAEHYLVDNGTIIVNECVDYKEVYLEDFQTKEEFEEEYDRELDIDEWLYNDYVIVCDYNFEDLPWVMF